MRISRPLMLPTTALAWILPMSCALDTSEKLRCEVPSDCVDGYECREHRCTPRETTGSDAALLAPTPLSGTRAGAQYLLSWSDNAIKESGYLVEGKSSAAEPFVTWAITSADQTEHQVVFTKKGSYVFRVFAVREAEGKLERSTPSNQVTTVVDVPEKPNVKQARDGSTLNLSWDPGDFKGETENCGYRVHYYYCDFSEALGPAVRTADCDATGISLEPGFPDDEYAVVAFNRWGESAPVPVCFGDGW